MRKLICLMTVLLLCASLIMPAFAAEEDGFVPSITYKPVPEIVPVQGEDGKDYIGIICNAEGEIIDYVEAGCLRITPVAHLWDEEIEIPEDIEVNAFEAKVLGDRGLISQIPARYRSTYFRHVFAGGYTVGYYSYIWAEVLDADAYQAFKETGDIFNPEVARKFRTEVLERGGEDDAMKLYVNFRGEEPGIDALLVNRGLK